MTKILIDEATVKLVLSALEAKDGWGSSIREAKEKAITALKVLAEQPALMSQPNRLIAYSAASKLRELGYEWLNDAWTHLDELAEQPAQQEPVYVQTRHKEEHGFSEWGSLLDPTHRNSKWAEGVEMRLLYTSPPAQRTWVELTDEEIDTAIGFVGSFGARQDARAIEAKLKEKNT